MHFLLVLPKFKLVRSQAFLFLASEFFYGHILTDLLRVKRLKNSYLILMHFLLPTEAQSGQKVKISRIWIFGVELLDQLSNIVIVNVFQR